jgi:hypothetical protein
LYGLGGENKPKATMRSYGNGCNGNGNGNGYVRVYARLMHIKRTMLYPD